MSPVERRLHGLGWYSFSVELMITILSRKWMIGDWCHLIDHWWVWGFHLFSLLVGGNDRRDVDKHDSIWDNCPFIDYEDVNIPHHNVMSLDAITFLHTYESFLQVSIVKNLLRMSCAISYRCNNYVNSFYYQVKIFSSKTPFSTSYYRLPDHHYLTAFMNQRYIPMSLSYRK